jgi:hypothetical protein
MFPAASQSVEQVTQHSAACGSGERSLIPVRQVHVPSAEQRPPRSEPEKAQSVEHVDQHWASGSS